MGKRITMANGTAMTIGVDLGDRHSVGCVLDGDGEVIERFSVRTTAEALNRPGFVGGSNP
jgi:predicted NBD/HSP70 family sugar kinase